MMYAVIALTASLAMSAAPSPTPSPALYHFQPFPPTPRAHPVFPPRPPAGLRFLGPVRNGRIRLSWSASFGATGYRVYSAPRPAAVGIVQLERSVPRLVTVVQATYADLAPGCYVVRAEDNAGMSRPSARVCAPSQLRLVIPRTEPTATPSGGSSVLRVLASPQQKLLGEMSHVPFGVPSGAPYNGGGSWPISVAGYAPVPMQFQAVTYSVSGGGAGQFPLPSDYSQFCEQYQGRATACLFFPANSTLTVTGESSPNLTKDVEAGDPTCAADGGAPLHYGNNQTGCSFQYPAIFNARVVQPSSTNWGYGYSCSSAFDVEMNGSTGVLTVRYPTAPAGSTMTTGAQPITCVVWVLVAHATLPHVKER